ncbi:MAG: hypothetical protein LBH45_05305 [Campylobacteraceae bacterium]|jgi:hypothetical protein|nr:hypothetical protein [Campylobacteraceae bacterium]
MAKCTCECDENAQQSVSSKVIRHILCTKSNQNLVIGTTEKLLPTLFWLGIIASIGLAFKASSSVAFFTNNAFYIILSFIGFLIAFLFVVIISFYTIYILKTLKDTVACKCDESCECENIKANDTLNSSVSETPIKKKPGPKRVVKRSRKPKATTTVAE